MATNISVNILYNFDNYTNDGDGYPEGTLLLDSTGDLFGIARAGSGTLFEMVIGGGGNYTPTILASGAGSGPFGYPNDNGLIVNAAGDLFGAETGNGSANAGAVFEAVNNGNGTYTLDSIFNFNGGTHGSLPSSGVIADAAGDLFGTTWSGGAYNQGTVYELVPNGNGGYSETILLSLNGANETFNGINPIGGLVADAAGDLFGTTFSIGPSDNGTIFELVKGSTGYTPKRLATLPGGENPSTPLVSNAAGDLFGTTQQKGAAPTGTVFELVNNGSGNYTSRTLYTFASGGDPEGGLLLDAKGDLFGTTNSANMAPYGTVFELQNDGDGSYTENTLVAFDGSTQGQNPVGGLVADAAGDLFGTNSSGSPSGVGTVFEITGSGFVTGPEDSANFTVTDATTGQTTEEAGTAYSGPVAGLTSELVYPAADQVTVTSGTPNVFIQVGEQGQPNPVIAGINVSQGNGNNVLDSYANSSFFTDGVGIDQNYIDTRAPTQNMWSTVVNFHSADNVTVWGVTQVDFNLDWIGDTEGATGYTGLTGVFVPTTAGQPEAAVTLAGVPMADLTYNQVTVTYDTINGTPYASIHAV